MYYDYIVVMINFKTMILFRYHLRFSVNADRECVIVQMGFGYDLKSSHDISIMTWILLLRLYFHYSVIKLC